MADNRDTLFTFGAILVALAVFGLAVVTGHISLTPPAPDRSPVRDLPRVDRPMTLDVNLGGRVISVEEKR